MAQGASVDRSLADVYFHVMGERGEGGGTLTAEEEDWV